MKKTEIKSGGVAHLNDGDIALFVDALRWETCNQLPRGMREHVAECHRCKREITSLFALLHNEKSPTITSHPYFILRHRERLPERMHLLKVAAAVAAIVGLAALAYFVGSIMNVPGHVRMAEARTGLEADSGGRGVDSSTRLRNDAEKVRSADLAVNADLEDLVNSQSRSENFEVSSPVNGTTISSGQLFRWKGRGEGPLSLSVIDNKGGVVLKVLVPGASYVLKRTLPSGLYYWKVQSESELLHVGKFFVKVTPPSKRNPPT